MLLTRIRAIAVILEIGVGLMMELEQLLGFSGYGIIPTTRIPGPRDALFAQAISERGLSLWRNQVIGFGGGGMWRVAAEGSIDHITIRSNRAVFGQHAVGIHLDQHIGRRIGESRRAGTGQ